MPLYPSMEPPPQDARRKLRLAVATAKKEEAGPFTLHPSQRGRVESRRASLDALDEGPTPVLQWGTGEVERWAQGHSPLAKASRN